MLHWCYFHGFWWLFFKVKNLPRIASISENDGGRDPQDSSDTFIKGEFGFIKGIHLQNRRHQAPFDFGSSGVVCDWTTEIYIKFLMVPHLARWPTAAPCKCACLFFLLQPSPADTKMAVIKHPIVFLLARWLKGHYCSLPINCMLCCRH